MTRLYLVTTRFRLDDARVLFEGERVDLTEEQAERFAAFVEAVPEAEE